MQENNRSVAPLGWCQRICCPPGHNWRTAESSPFLPGSKLLVKDAGPSLQTLIPYDCYSYWCRQILLVPATCHLEGTTELSDMLGKEPTNVCNWRCLPSLISARNSQLWWWTDPNSQATLFTLHLFVLRFLPPLSAFGTHRAGVLPTIESTNAYAYICIPQVLVTMTTCLVWCSISVICCLFARLN